MKIFKPVLEGSPYAKPLIGGEKACSRKKRNGKRKNGKKKRNGKKRSGENPKPLSLPNFSF
ncbi:MAG: hypothetical protein QXJ63_00770 [Candidatus Bathyarchaeia archaeon]